MMKNNVWHPCRYEPIGDAADWDGIDDFLGHLEDDGTWEDGRWYEWLDKYDNREVARMKLDAYDHFSPPTKIIREQDVIAFRELRGE